MASSATAKQEKFKVKISVVKVMASVFWDSEGTLLVEFF
jgi:hypothetical protein